MQDNKIQVKLENIEFNSNSADRKIGFAVAAFTCVSMLMKIITNYSHVEESFNDIGLTNQTFNALASLGTTGSMMIILGVGLPYAAYHTTKKLSALANGRAYVATPK